MPSTTTSKIYQENTYTKLCTLFDALPSAVQMWVMTTMHNLVEGESNKEEVKNTPAHDDLPHAKKAHTVDRPAYNDTTTSQSSDQAMRNAMAIHDIAESANNALIELEAMFQAILELSSVRNDSLLVSLASIGVDMADRQFEVFSAHGVKARLLMYGGDHV